MVNNWSNWVTGFVQFDLGLKSGGFWFVLCEVFSLVFVYVVALFYGVLDVFVEIICGVMCEGLDPVAVMNSKVLLYTWISMMTSFTFAGLGYHCIPLY